MNMSVKSFLNIYQLFSSFLFYAVSLWVISQYPGTRLTQYSEVGVQGTLLVSDPSLRWNCSERNSTFLHLRVFCLDELQSAPSPTTSGVGTPPQVPFRGFTLEPCLSHFTRVVDSNPWGVPQEYWRQEVGEIFLCSCFFLLFY